MEFIIHITDGKFQNTRKLSEHLKSLENGRYLIKVTPFKKRSIEQNSWFHAVLPEIVKGLRDAGFNEVRNEHDAKEIVKAMFFKKTFSNGIEEIEVVEGTSAQSKINFAEKADQIITWAREYLGIDIEPPAKQLTMQIDEP
jgi:hypothetical protein